MVTRLKVVLFIFLIPIVVFSNENFIPRHYNNNPATDLTYKGIEISQDEAHDLWVQSKGEFDLSRLDPTENTDLWKNQMPASLEAKLDQLPIDYMDEIQYHSVVPSRTGNFRFNVMVKKGNSNQTLTLFLSKNIHNILLAKNLLRKIGYTVPAIKFLPKVVLNFKSAQEKTEFINYLEQEAMAGDAEDWVIKEISETKIVIQDIVALDPHDTIYNLALRKIPPGLINGERLLRSLSIPFAITNAPESVNMLRWTIGRVTNDQVAIDLDYADEFETTFEDARWISRRIEHLKRADWIEIVDQAHYPRPVALILTEKLIARRNSLIKLFDTEGAKISVDDKISSGVELVDGKLTLESWPGFASRFSYGDPESPLSNSEIANWLKSKGISFLIDNMISGVNAIPGISTNIGQLSDAELQTYLANNLEQTPNGPIQHTPVQAWFFPTYHGEVGVSRNIIAGSYMGTDNMVQLADAMSFNISVGMYMGVGGLFPFTASANADASILRSYTHLRPITSVKKALKYPYKNMFIPMVKADYGKKLKELLSLDWENIPENERAGKIAEGLKPFKENIDIGESLIVTDSIVISSAGRIGIKKTELIKAQLGLGVNQSILTRLHIHRKSENVFHIYRDYGQNKGVQLNFGVASLIPILKEKAGISDGTALVQFYRMNIDPNNPKTIENLSSLRQAIVFNRLKKLKKVQKPFEVKHNFNEKTHNLGLLVWRLNQVNSYTQMTIKHPSGEARRFFRRYLGTTKGHDYQDYINNSISNFISMLFQNSGFNYAGTGTPTNPGFSFKGKAENRMSVFDSEIDNKGMMKEPFIKFSRIFNGWSIDREGAQKILDRLKNEYRFEFFEPNVLSNSQKLFLYNITLNILVYEKGLNHMLNLSEDSIKELLKNHARTRNLAISSKNNLVDSGEVRLIRFLKNYNKAKAKYDIEKMSLWSQKFFNLAEKKLNIDGITKMLGGKENFYAMAKIDGFRTGDERGDEAILSNTLGEIGNKNYFGPLQQLMNQTEMMEGEFFIYWMMTRLI